MLQEREFERVGGTKTIKADVRVVAATNRDLEKACAEGDFREDLYYRINVLPIQTTPLRQRSDDVALLLTHYAERLARGGVQPVSFEPLFLNMLERYTWPGNVRELANLVDRLSTLLPGQNIGVRQVPTCMLPKALAAMQIEFISEQHGIQEVPLAVLYEKEAVLAQVEPQKNQDQGLLESTDDWVALLSATVASEPLPASPSSLRQEEASNDELNQVEQAIFMAQGIQTLPPHGLSLKQHMIDIERSLIEQALAVNRGNVSKTAKLLQLQRTTLIEKINKYELRTAG